MSTPDGPRFRLDGVVPLGASPPGEAGALGRDPFEGVDLPDPVLDDLSILPPPRPPARPLGEEIPAEPRGLLERWMGDDVCQRLAALEALAAAQEPGAAGVSPRILRRVLPPFLALYRNWFRVRSRGHENLPAEGAAILAANHGGLLPFDGAMTVLDVWLRSAPPRLPRAIFDRFAARIGPVRRLFESAGAVTASRESFAQQLRTGHLVLVFPEGMEGIVKPVTQRYRLQTFHTGFVRQALQQQVPVVPVAILGSDDQAPILYDVKPLARRLGLPAAPITPTFPWFGPLGLVPYPVRYCIVYGEPIDFASRYGPEASGDDRLVGELARRVRSKVQRLVDRNRS